jgi:hypothetical protein
MTGAANAGAESRQLNTASEYAQGNDFRMIFPELKSVEVDQLVRLATDVVNR